MVGAGGIAERGADPTIVLGDQVLVREPLALVAPRVPRDFVEVFREGLREPVGERLDHDRAVVVLLGLEPRRELVGAVDRDGERSEVVAFGSDVVGEAAVRPRVSVGCLLAEEAEPGPAVEKDIVAFAARRPEAEDALRAQARVAHDLVEQLRGVVVELGCRGILQNRRELALQLPRVEEELPVDVVAEGRELRVDELPAREGRHRQVVVGHPEAVCTRLLER